ncbi:MAG: hypothetical protein ACYDDS_06265 [Candidatus Sulfotelmatobacter sp.]|jgi:hypothetical protein
MRLSLSVNGAAPIVASLPGRGYLSAHLNMSDRPKENENNKDVRINGMQTEETETVHLKWPTLNLKIGDVVELRVLPNGNGDQPSEIRRSSESKYNLFSSVELAKELLQAVSEFEGHLTELRRKSKEEEPADEHKKFIAANGAVAWDLGQNFLYPVYRRHKELIPEELKGELL